MLTKDQITAAVTRRTTTIPSAVFGGDISIRELSRLEWREAARESEVGKDDAGQPLTNIDQWNSRVFAAGVIDAGGAALFAAADILAWPRRADLWAEIGRIASAIIDLSEVGPAALKEPSSD